MIDFELIWRKLHHKISGEEEKELNEWLSEDQKHRDYFHRISDVYTNKRSKFLSDTEIEDSFHKIYVKTSPKIKIRRIISYSASVAAVIGIILLLLFRNTHERIPIESQQITSNIETIKPGETKAILVMGNGESYQLSEGINLKKVVENTKIVSSGKSISYSVENEKKSTDKIEYNTLIIPRGGEFFLILGDSTKVWLNSESELKYPVRFSSDARNVELTGEAYFEVTKDKSRPFRVYSLGQVVEVFGTEFNISSYKNDPVISTTLVNGIVKVSSLDNPSNNQMLYPNHQTFFDKGDQTIKQHVVNPAEYIAWKDGRFYFSNERLDTIMYTLQRWYNIDVHFQNETIKKYRFTGNVKRYDNFEQILKLIQKTNEIDYEIKDQTVEIKAK